MKIITYFFAALLCALLTPLASQAAFNPIPGHVYEIRNRHTSRSLEVGGGDRYAEGHTVNLWGYWGGSNQQWQFERVGTTGDNYKIYNRNSRQALKVLSVPDVSSSPDLVLPVGQSGTGNNDIWKIVELPSGGLTISRTYPSIYLPPGRSTFLLRTDAPYIYTGGTSGNNSVVVSPDAGTYANQYLWDIQDRSAAVQGVFRIMNVNSDKALSANENNSVTQSTMYYLAGQEWTFSDKNSNGYISVINRNTNQVLEIGGGKGSQAGAYANVWDGYGNAWQQWQLVSTDGNNTPLTVQQIYTTGITCKLINRYSGFALEIGGGGDLTRDNLPADQWYDYNGLNQQWHIYIDSNYRGTALAAGTAASDLVSNTLTLYPNPASTTLQLTLPGNGKALQVTITDARGRTVPVAHQNGKVDVSNLASGLYIISAADGQKTFRQKFIKE